MADFVTRVVNDQSCLCNKTYKNVKEREHGRYIYIQGIYLQRIKMASAKNVGNGVAQESTWVKQNALYMHIVCGCGQENNMLS